MIIPGTVDLVAWRNADFDEIFTFVDDATPLNLTGYTFALQVRVQPKAGGTPLISRTTTPPLGLLIDGPGGTVSLNITHAELEALPFSDPFNPAVFYYDLTGQPSGDALAVYLTGRFLVYPGVTR